MTMSADMMVKEPEIVLSTQDIVANVQQLLPLVRASAEEARSLRHVPADLVEAFRRAGMFRVGYDAQWGGPDMSIEDQVKLIAEISKADAAIGWSVMISCKTGYYTALLPGEVARDHYPSIDLASSISFHPTGRGDIVPEGVRISGGFRFATGVDYADRIWAHVSLHRPDGTCVEADGKPSLFRVLLYPHEITIAKDWETTAMQGTGSGGFRVDDVIVPGDRCILVAHDIDEARPKLSRYRDLTVISQIGVILGHAGHILESFQSCLLAKNSRGGAPSMSEQSVHVGYHKAFAYFEAAHASAFEAIRRLDAALDMGREHVAMAIERAHRMVVMSAQLCRMAIDEAFEQLGTDAIRKDTPFAALLADFRAIMTHGCHRQNWYSEAERWRVLCLDERRS
jgi:alkylation response protein AidB-like acyl-CoA dehydrogenase